MGIIRKKWGALAIVGSTAALVAYGPSFQKPYTPAFDRKLTTSQWLREYVLINELTPFREEMAQLGTQWSALSETTPDTQQCEREIRRYERLYWIHARLQERDREFWETRPDRPLIRTNSEMNRHEKILSHYSSWVMPCFEQRLKRKPYE